MGGIELLSPTGLLVALGAAAPLAALALLERRAANVRRALGLRRPPFGPALAVAAALVLAAVFLGVAAAQPVVTGRQRLLRQTDGEALFVLDVSRSMKAAIGSRGRTRFDRAHDAAAQMRTHLPGVPVGLASLTDRLLPHLFPTPDRDAFDLTLDRAMGVERPAPQYSSARATSFTALITSPLVNFFSRPAVPHVVVVFTDGEGGSEDAHNMQSLLQHSRPPTFVFVRFWDSRERVYDRGLEETGYRPDAQASERLAEVLRAVHGRLFDESQIDAAAKAVRRAVGPAGARRATESRRNVALAPYAAGAAFLPLLFVLFRRNRA
jgi:von Willebrand factor type A domain